MSKHKMNVNRGKKKYSYPQLAGTGRRRDHGSDVQPQSVSLDMHKRQRALVLARDLFKECDVMRWAVDFHCLNTTSFGFRPMSDDQGFNTALQDFYNYFNETCDIAGRYRFEELWDVWEHRRVLDGDVLVVLLNDGRLQTIQSNWIVEDGSDVNCVQGLYLDPFGKTMGYHVERQTTHGKKVCYSVPAKYADLIAYYDYEVDAYRGASPLLSSLTGYQDLDEILVDMYSKIKLESRLGLAIKSKKNELGYRPTEASPTPTAGGGEVIGTVDSHGNVSTTGQRRQQLKMDEMVNVLRLGANDELSNFMQTSPSTTFQQFFLMAVQAVLKPLGIPLTIYQENLSNYYCSRAAYGLYQNYIKDIVYGNWQRYMKYFRWRLAVADKKGEFKLPRGMLASQVPFSFMSETHSVLDEDREAKGDQLQIRMGFSTPQKMAAKRGESYYDNIRDTAKAIAYAKEHGVPVDGLTETSGDTSQQLLNRYNAIAIAVRGGFLTPSPEIEMMVRDELQLPSMNTEVAKAWEATGCLRQPITLKTEESDAIADALNIEEPNDATENQ